MYSRDIDSWLSYAFSMKVQELELNLSNLNYFRYRSYCFPSLIDPSSDEYSGKTSVQDSNHLVLTEFRILKSLDLAGVNMSVKAIDSLLCKFPLLERLKVCHSIDLESIKVCGRSLALKYLEITHCMNLGSIIVQDSHLVSLKITMVPELVLEKVPMLVDVWISAHWVGDILPHLYISLSKVKVLTLSVKIDDIEDDEDNKVDLVPQLPAVNQLVLIVESTNISSSLIPLISLLLRSIPNLEKFVLEVKSVVVYPQENIDNYEERLNLPLEHLKVVEFHGGYHKLGVEYQFAKYLLGNAKALEEIVLKPSDEDVWHYRPTIRDKAKASAKRLREVLPSTVKLAVL